MGPSDDKLLYKPLDIGAMVELQARKAKKKTENVLIQVKMNPNPSKEYA